MTTYTTKDSGERQEFSSGMKRDTQTGKPRYDLCDKAMYKRWAELMGRGAEKYGENNWKNANSQEELERFKASAERHLMQWLNGDTDEDHAAAVMFNVAAGEYLKEKIKLSVIPPHNRTEVFDNKDGFTPLCPWGTEDCSCIAKNS